MVWLHRTHEQILAIRALGVKEPLGYLWVPEKKIHINPRQICSTLPHCKSKLLKILRNSPEVLVLYPASLGF